MHAICTCSTKQILFLEAFFHSLPESQNEIEDQLNCIVQLKINH